MTQLCEGLSPLLVGQRRRVDVQVVAQQGVAVPDVVRLRAAVGQLYSFFISASLTSDRAPSTGTTDRK